MGKRILFLSNGHGEDLNSSLILQAIWEMSPDIEVGAMPIVGRGQAYRRLGVPIIGPTQQLPSGGFNYINFLRFLNPVNWFRDLNPINLVRDLSSGLLVLTWRQIKAVRRYSQSCDLLFATGDVVPILFAYVTGRPFMVFLVSSSSYYEGRVKLPWMALMGLRSGRCRQIFTRDQFTAADLQSRGLTQTVFAGYPIMDVLNLTPHDLALNPDLPMIALIPGSRLPEALQNLTLQLQLCEAIWQRQPIQFRAALVPSISDMALHVLATDLGWQFDPETGILSKADLQVGCYRDAFANILHHCHLVIGMAGTAVEQAVGLGKPVVQIIGAGPQFTYPFAEAQMRLLGISVLTIGRRQANTELLQQAADKIFEVLKDAPFLAACRRNGLERVGRSGGSQAIAYYILQKLNEVVTPS